MDQLLEVDSEGLFMASLNAFNKNSKYNHFTHFDKIGFLGEFSGNPINESQRVFMICLEYNGDVSLVYRLKIPNSELSFKEMQYIKDYTYKSFLINIAVKGLSVYEQMANTYESPNFLTEDWSRVRGFYMDGNE